MRIKTRALFLITLLFCVSGACAKRAVVLTPKPAKVKPFEKEVKEWISSLKQTYVSMNSVDLLVNAGWRATLYLVDALQDGNFRIRGLSALALGKIGSRVLAFHKPLLTQYRKIIVPALLKALKDGEAWVRNHVAEALGRIGKAGDTVGVALKGIFNRKVVPALTRLLKDEKAYVRRQAARALKKIGRK